MTSMLARALGGDIPRSGDSDRTDALAVLADFRTDWFACLTSRPAELFELTDAVLRVDGPVKTLVGPPRRHPPMRLQRREGEPDVLGEPAQGRLHPPCLVAVTAAAIRLHWLDLQRQIALTDHGKINIVLELGSCVVDMCATWQVDAHSAGHARRVEEHVCGRAGTFKIAMQASFGMAM
ncbi:hypothetical protein [Streptosporangium sp. NPDC000396]|uniref:hypothetical protein n=1 Tax=Streptosporangium sp. NPDC000396 TaxID=3366185 RepID=UPI0036955490